MFPAMKMEAIVITPTKKKNETKPIKNLSDVKSIVGISPTMV